MLIVDAPLWRGNLPCLFVACATASITGKGDASVIGGSLFDAILRDRSILSDVGKTILNNGAEFGFREVRSARREGKGGLGIFQTRVAHKDPLSRHLVYMSAASLSVWMKSNPDIAVRMEYPSDGASKKTIGWIDDIIARLLTAKNLTVVLG